MSVNLDITSRDSIAAALRQVVLRFGGLDGLVNTAAIFPVPGPEGKISPEAWSKTFEINITGNYLLADETRRIFQTRNYHPLSFLPVQRMRSFPNTAAKRTTSARALSIN